MKKYLSKSMLVSGLVLYGLLLFSCSKEAAKEPTYGMNVKYRIYIDFQNQEGQNLLDSLKTGAYKVEEMKLFYLIDKKPVWVSFETGFNSLGSGIRLTSNNSLEVSLWMGSANVVTEKEAYKIVENTAYLQLTSKDTDTIISHHKVAYGYNLLAKVWYNGELVWTGPDGNMIEITKK